MNDRSWHDESFPELREGRPWVMEEMILAEPGLARPILGENAGADAVAEALGRAAKAGEPVVVTGCGTSEHGALAIVAILSDALGPSVRVESRQALDAALEPRAGGLCLAVSHDGGTHATALALEAARGAGARTGLVTARPESPVAAHADLLLVTPLADRSWCHTVAYVSAILAGEALAGRLREAPADIEAVEQLLVEAVALRPRHVEAASLLAGVERIVAAGLGADEISARELALKVEEGVRLPAAARHLETLLHGHLAGCDARTGLVLIAADRRGGERAARRLDHAARAAAAIGMPTVVLAVPEGAGAARGPAAALLGGAIGLQLLTLELAHAAGVRPDLIRREDRPWREAAAVADGDGW